MIYSRHILDVVHRQIATWPVVILEGPRTVGKSTLLQEIATSSGVKIVDLDEPDVRQQVEADPQGYVKGTRPVLIDEYPKIPQLIQHIKAQLNRDGSPGQFILTGSASLEASRSDLDALVGRYGDVLILPLSQSEIEGRSGNFVEQVLRDAEALRSSGPSGTDRESYIRRVLTGGFPLLVKSLDPTDRYQRFSNYVDQSINYGMANLAAIRERENLQLLLYRYAAQTGQLLNMRGAARDVGLKQGTAENYTRLLETLFLIHRLPAWKATDSGPVSRPKLYVVDSGVAGRLLRLTEERVRSGEPLFLKQYGHLLETFVLGEIRKMLSWMDGPSTIGYWRNRRGNEVDIVVERPDDDAVIGIEVKSGARVAQDDWKGLRTFREEVGSRFHAGLVMYTGDMPYRLDDGIYAIPIDKLWEGPPQPVERPQSTRTRYRTPATTTGAGNDFDRVLTADGDPLPEPIRASTRKMIHRMDIGEASYWEVAVVPPENVHFGDFYTREGVAGALHAFHAWSGGDTEPIDQCVVVVHRPRRSPMGHDAPGFGALVHPLGSIVFVVAAVEDHLHASTGRHFISDWSKDLIRFSRQVLSPHAASWTYWSAGRRLRTGQPVFAGVVGSEREASPAEAVVDNPPHKGVPLADDPGPEAFLLAATFYEWFGIPARELARITDQPTQMVVSHGDHVQQTRQPHYADRLRIEPIGTTWRMWHGSHGQNRGGVATLAQVEDQDGVVWYVLTSQLPKLNALLRHMTPCEAARWVVDWYNEESERVARRCFEVSERYPLADCRRAVDIAGLPKAINWLTDPAGIPTKIRHWANLVGPVAEPTRPGLPAYDVTDRQPGKPLIREFLAIDCE